MKVIPAIMTMSNYVEVVRFVRDELGIDLAKDLEVNNIKPNDPRATCHLIGLVETYSIDEVALDIMHFGYLVIGKRDEIALLSQVLRGSVYDNRAIFSGSVREWQIYLMKLSKLGEKEFVTIVTNHLCQIGLRKFFAN